MTNRFTPAQQEALARRQAPKLAMTEWHSITITRYSDGTARAYHNRLDQGTRKLVTERLCDPQEPSTDLPWHVLGLTNAAEELEVAHRMNEGLW